MKTKAVEKPWEKPWETMTFSGMQRQVMVLHCVGVWGVRRLLIRR